MKRLHSFLIKSYVGPFLAAFFITEFILLMQFLWKYIDDLVGKGLSTWVIIKLFIYTSTTLVPMAMPIAVLLSAIMTFGNLGENYELTAMKAAGISLLKIMFPLIIFNMFLSVGSHFFYNNIMPVTNLKAKSLLYDVRQKRLDINIKEGVFYNGIDGYSIKVAKKNKENGMMYDMMIYDHTSNRGNVDVTLADSASMKITPDRQYMVIKLYNGKKYTYLEERHKSKRYRTYPEEIQMFDKEVITMKLSGFGFKRTDEDLFKQNYQMMNTRQLRKTSDSLEQTLIKNEYFFTKNLLSNNYIKRLSNKDTLEKISVTKSLNIDSLFKTQNKQTRLKIIKSAIDYARSTNSYITSSVEDFNWRKKWLAKFEIEYQKKYSVPVACFILFFIGAPLGAIIRKGGLGWPVVISVFFFMLYYVISIISEKSVQEGILPPVIGVWMSTFILAPIGIILTYKSNNDSAMFDINTYTEPFKKLFKKIISIIKKKR